MGFLAASVESNRGPDTSACKPTYCCRLNLIPKLLKGLRDLTESERSPLDSWGPLRFCGANWGPESLSPLRPSPVYSPIALPPFASLPMPIHHQNRCCNDPCDINSQEWHRVCIKIYFHNVIILLLKGRFFVTIVVGMYSRQMQCCVRSEKV